MVDCMVLHVAAILVQEFSLFSTRLHSSWSDFYTYSTIDRIHKICILTGKSLHTGFLALENSLMLQLEIFWVSLVMPKNMD